MRVGGTVGQTSEGLKVSYGTVGGGLELSGAVVRVGLGLQAGNSRFVRATTGAPENLVGWGPYAALRVRVADLDGTALVASVVGSSNLSGGTPGVAALTLGLSN